MTLLISVNSPETVWLMADRRITNGSTVVRDHARKVMILEASDGVVLLGYAGLGLTVNNTEPADWMNSVLRGRDKDTPMEHLLGILGEAAKLELPAHRFGVPHLILGTGFINAEHKFSTTELIAGGRLGGPLGLVAFRFTRRIVELPPHVPPRTPSLFAARSGARWLMDRRWRRELRGLVNAHRRGKISPHAVADRLAAINFQVHQTEPTVGPRCVVVWRYRREGIHKGGGGQQFYDRTERVRARPGDALPTMGSGIDINALVGAIQQPMMEQMMAQIAAVREGIPVPKLDEQLIEAATANLPDTPDEQLR